MKDFMPEDFWIRAAKTGIVVFALRGQPGLTELVGELKIHFHDRQGDFYCWLNTTMIGNRVILDASDLDGFDKRKLPSPGFVVEIVMIDYDGTVPSKTKVDNVSERSAPSSSDKDKVNPPKAKLAAKQDSNDNVFSDSEAEETVPSRSIGNTNSTSGIAAPPESSTKGNQIAGLTHQTEQISPGSGGSTHLSTNTSKETNFDRVERTASIPNLGSGDIKAIAADASVLSFGDEEDYESE